MKIRGLILMILMMFSIHMKAQEVSFGLKGGVNYSSGSKGDFDNQSITSFHIGGMMEALYDNNFAIQPEIIFSNQGFDFIENGNESNIKLTYINIPIMIKYYIFNGIAVEAGPQIGYLNSAEFNTNSTEGSESTDIKGGLKDNDLSFNAGIGFQLNNGLNFNARYCYGLTNIVNQLSDLQFKNRVLQLSVGYFF